MKNHEQRTYIAYIFTFVCTQNTQTDNQKGSNQQRKLRYVTDNFLELCNDRFRVF